MLIDDLKQLTDSLNGDSIRKNGNAEALRSANRALQSCRSESVKDLRMAKNLAKVVKLIRLLKNQGDPTAMANSIRHIVDGLIKREEINKEREATNGNVDR